MEIELGQLIPAALAGIVGSAGTWFTLARSLVTRAEVEKMIRDRMEALNAHQARQEQSIDAMRVELTALTREVIRLGVLLETNGHVTGRFPAGTDETKRN
jgi:uncharacterized coiled-coil protein SlyX